MKYSLLSLIVVLATAGVAVGQTAYLFVPQNGTSGEWSTSSNWSPTGTPGYLDSATIPSGKTCNISTSSADIDSVTVNGTLHISERSLTIHGGSNSTSTVNGTLSFNVVSGAAQRPELLLNTSIRIDGTGLITGRRASGNTGYGVIRSCPTDTCARTLEVGAELEVAGSIKFETMDLELLATISSAAALIVDSSYDEMIIGADLDAAQFTTFHGKGSLDVSAGVATFANTAYISGCIWTVNVIGGDVLMDADSVLTGTDMLVYVDSGDLTVETDLSIGALVIGGGAAFFSAELQDGEVTVSSGSLTFDAACAPTGAFEVTGGTVEVNDTVTATDLLWSGGSFVVAGGKSISFDP